VAEGTAEQLKIGMPLLLADHSINADVGLFCIGVLGLRINLENVSKKYGRVHALAQVSFELVPGQIVSVLGANGAGKTTLLRCLSSVASPDKGKIFFDGELFRRNRMDLRRRLAFLPDFPAMYPHLKPLQHIAMVLGLYEKDDVALHERAIEALGNLDLLPLIDTQIGRLSRGQIYKTALAAMLLVDPELWLLDEPLASGMDPMGIMYFKKECRAAALRGRTILYSTQLLDIAENFSDRVCVLHRGTPRVFEEVAELRKQTAMPEGALEEIFRRLREGES